ncbi:SDR family NAD(P)-dependent oxidoreductase [Nocardia sp. alder85J]|uniref:SDR family NAD(P)-dependent oxidoreductase n=1 Tax=Nocardia sp. alder85J TaxID=2862949 RepID=UPI001CD2CA53|nr:SDR family NAD(P)-dependent oxidoreductase [Nocardia sp. alder85J]MCX4092042.1 SDR family NAD(P)-dependent oxidoreductase [Nocardia sp. alder85J]
MTDDNHTDEPGTGDDATAPDDDNERPEHDNHAATGELDAAGGRVTGDVGPSHEPGDTTAATVVDDDHGTGDRTSRADTGGHRIGHESGTGRAEYGGDASGTRSADMPDRDDSNEGHTGADGGSGRRSSRRRLLGALAATGVAAGAAGLAGGVALGIDATPPRLHATTLRRFDGKVVVITGATSGIGAAAAKLFAAEGARVAFCGRRTERGAAVERDIRAAGGEATYIRADVLVEDDVRRFVDTAADRYGGLHVAFNNAGITIQKKLHEYSAEEFDRVVHTNLRGSFLALKYEVPHMLRGGGGTVVITASSNALATDANRGAYTASKRGLVGLVQAAALDYAGDGIRVNALVPGTTDTELVRRAAGMENIPDDAWEVFVRQWARSNVPGMGRLATAEEIATFALTLAAPDYPYLTGAQLVIDGGKTAHA